MHISITKTEVGNNKGSVAALVTYLDKEDRGKAAHSKNSFFSHSQNQVSGHEVMTAMDNNHLGLKNKDAKYYLINISPSQKELNHIGNDKATLREYTRQVMDGYAQNFNRDIEGKDLLYFAKIEYNRFHPNGSPKAGLQTHIHVIVSRKDRHGKRQFSPLTHHRNTSTGPVRGGFNRKTFQMKGEEIFDKLTKYERSPEESFKYRFTMKHGNLKAKFMLRQNNGVPPKSPQLLSTLLRRLQEPERDRKSKDKSQGRE